MQTRDQKYAATIIDQVSEMNNNTRLAQKQYGAMAHRLPILIRIAGLAQALEFVWSRGRDTQRLLLTHIAKAVYGEETNVQELLSRSRDAQLGEYMHLTQEVMAALVWYKRFAQSVLKVEVTDETGVDDSVEGVSE